MGAVSSDTVTRKVESAKPLPSFGVMNADLVMGGFADHLERGQIIECSDTSVSVGYHTYHDVPLQAFLPTLIKAGKEHGYKEGAVFKHKKYSYTPVKGNPLVIERVMECISSQIDEPIRLMVDPGDSLMGSIEVPVRSLMLVALITQPWGTQYLQRSGLLRLTQVEGLWYW